MTIAPHLTTVLTAQRPPDDIQAVANELGNQFSQILGPINERLSQLCEENRSLRQSVTVLTSTLDRSRSDFDARLQTETTRREELESRLQEQQSRAQTLLEQRDTVAAAHYGTQIGRNLSEEELRVTRQELRQVREQRQNLIQTSIPPDALRVARDARAASEAALQNERQRAQDERRWGDLLNQFHSELDQWRQSMKYCTDRLIALAAPFSSAIQNKRYAELNRANTARNNMFQARLEMRTLSDRLNKNLALSRLHLVPREIKDLNDAYIYIHYSTTLGERAVIE